MNSNKLILTSANNSSSQRRNSEVNLSRSLKLSDQKKKKSLELPLLDEESKEEEKILENFDLLKLKKQHQSQPPATQQKTQIIFQKKFPKKSLLFEKKIPQDRSYTESALYNYLENSMEYHQIIQPDDDKSSRQQRQPMNYLASFLGPESDKDSMESDQQFYSQENLNERFSFTFSSSTSSEKSSMEEDLKKFDQEYAEIQLSQLMQSQQLYTPSNLENQSLFDIFLILIYKIMKESYQEAKQVQAILSCQDKLKESTATIDKKISRDIQKKLTSWEISENNQNLFSNILKLFNKYGNTFFNYSINNEL